MFESGLSYILGQTSFGSCNFFVFSPSPFYLTTAMQYLRIDRESGEPKPTALCFALIYVIKTVV